MKMPCKDKEGKQRRFCFLTDEFTDFSQVRKKKQERRFKNGGSNRTRNNKGGKSR